MRVEYLQELLRTGRFTRVVFVKRTDNTRRVMICRTGVRKGLKGVGMGYNPEEKDLVNVYDVQKRAYRNVSAERVLEISSGPRKFYARDGLGYDNEPKAASGSKPHGSVGNN